jgi:hypothetical protein
MLLALRENQSSLEVKLIFFKINFFFVHFIF